MKQEGREQVREQEAAQTGHLQSSSGTARAARRPGTPLPGNGRGAARALSPRLQPGGRDEAAARRHRRPAQAPRVRRPRRAPCPGGAVRGLRGARSLGTFGPRAPGPALSALPASRHPGPLRPSPATAAAARAAPCCSGRHRRRSCSVSSYFPSAAGGAAGPRAGGGAGGGVGAATPRHRLPGRRRGPGARRLERARGAPPLPPPSPASSPVLRSSPFSSSRLLLPLSPRLPPPFPSQFLTSSLPPASPSPSPGLGAPFPPPPRPPRPRRPGKRCPSPSRPPRRGTLDPFSSLRGGGGTTCERCSEKGWGALQGWGTRGGGLRKVRLQGLECVGV